MSKIFWGHQKAKSIFLVSNWIFKRVLHSNFSIIQIGIYDYTLFKKRRTKCYEVLISRWFQRSSFSFWTDVPYFHMTSIMMSVHTRKNIYKKSALVVEWIQISGKGQIREDILQIHLHTYKLITRSKKLAFLRKRHNMYLPNGWMP